LGIRAFRYMGFSVYGLLGIRAFGYTGFSVLKPKLFLKLFLGDFFSRENAKRSVAFGE
jgi:hypothetical protein